VRFLLAIAIVVAWITGVAADTIPLPRPRPPEAGGPPAAAPEQGADKTADKKKPDEPPPPSVCFTRLREIAVIKQLPNIDRPGGCLAGDVVQLEAVIMPDDSKVAVEPASTFRCEMATAVAGWIREDLAASVAAKLGGPLRAVDSFDSFSCRGRNNVAGAMLSEHGKANALDIRSLKLVNGTSAQPTDPNIPKDFRDAMRKSACERFKTVLGPGADGHHEEHIHVDLAERRSGYRICQWEVRQPIHRVLPSPHIVSETEPRPHVAPASLPVAAAIPEEKPRNQRQRRL
jgi:hypothetical protein